MYFSRGIPTVYKRIDYKLLGLYLKSFRKEISLTRDCAARCCGINNRTLENYEKGKTPPSLDFINVFAKLYVVHLMSCCKNQSENEYFKQKIKSLNKIEFGVLAFYNMKEDFVWKTLE